MLYSRITVVPLALQLPAQTVSAASPLPGPPADLRLSTPLTLLSALILLAGIGFVVWLHHAIPPLERLAAPERALALLVGRTMDLERALTRLSPWERFFFELSTGDSSRELEQSVDWYRELVEQSGSPASELELAILLAEGGQRDEVTRLADEWATRRDPYPNYAALLRAAYLGVTPDRDTVKLLEAEAADALPHGWFYDHVMLNLADSAGDKPLRSHIEAQSFGRQGALLRKGLQLATVEWMLVCVGLGALAWIIRHRRDLDAVRVADAPVPSRWAAWPGAQVLIIGGAIEIVLTIVLLFGESHSLVLRLLAIPMATVPLVVLALRYLLGPWRLSPAQAFGLQPVERGWSNLFLLLPAVFAAISLGEWGLGHVAERLRLGNHWTEWFDSDLIYGGGAMFLVSLFEYVVLAPVVEEFTFRGLLFATLRRRVGLWPAALISSTIFAAAHGYGIVGFLSVLWSGVLWAWAYEKSGSLLPGILAHALNNLTVCTGLVMLLRSS